ncbi:uncharacterized protein [Diadema setosum]|uniref:uncharacterized protein n=1 Tax=Diadema setosum TaxID=31175 RepID=UPI003B3B818F
MFTPVLATTLLFLLLRSPCIQGNLRWSFGDEFMLVGDYSRRAIYASNIRDISYTRLPLSNPGNAYSLDYDPVRQLLFWTYGGNPGRIQSSRLDGSDAAVVVSTDIREPYGVAVDPSESKVYWSDYYTSLGKIAVVNYDGSGSRTLVSLPQKRPYGVTINPIRRELYWGVQGPGAIQRMSIDALNAEPESVVDTQITYVRGLAFNNEGTKMYWHDDGSNRIESLDLLSGERTLLLTRSGFRGLTWHNEEIYLTETSRDVIAIMNETSRGVRFVGPRTFSNAYDICVVSSLKDPSQWACDFDNFGSNLCGWSQDFQDDFDWLRLPRNISRNSENGPSIGDYSMFINGTTQDAGARANFTSPYTNTVSTTATCLRFAFLMPGVSSHSFLNLYFTNQSFSKLIWLKRGDQGAFWKLARVVTSGLGEGHFIFEGVVGTPERSVIGVDDVQFGPCDDQFDAPKVSCDNGRMEILLKRESYRISAPSQIRFSDSRCYGYAFNSDYVTLSTSFEECGTRIASDEENFFFTNEIEDVSGVMQSFVVNCTVRRRQLVHTSYIAQSSLSVFTEAFGHGNFTIAIRQFTSQNFDVALPEPAPPQQVFEGDTIYLGTTIASMRNLYILNERCWETPSPDPADRSYRDLIESGLAVSRNVEIFDINNSTVKAFSVRAFQFSRVTELTYIHCNVLACQQNDRLESCQTSDRSGPRAKRSSNRKPANGYILSSGPFVVQRNKGMSVSLVTVYLTLSAVLVCIASLVGVILYQRRQINRK